MISYRFIQRILYIAAILASLVIVLTNVGSNSGPHASKYNVPFGPLKAAGRYYLIRYHWCKELKYLPQSRQPRSVALASYPGSGNTWLRYLLQQTTGILTGSIYKDSRLINSGFPEKKTDKGSTVLVIKTHGLPLYDYKQYDLTVLLMRHPKDVFLSGSEKGRILMIEDEMDRKRNGQEKYWQWLVETFLDQHFFFYQHWLTVFDGPVHVVLYNELVKDTRNTLRGILHFLNYSVIEEDIACALTYQEGIYRSPRRASEPIPLTPEMLRKFDLHWKRLLRLVANYPYRVRPNMSAPPPLTPHTPLLL